jgi:site-specific DNA recombinase
MTGQRQISSKPAIRCAIYTRVSTDQGLEQEFNSLDAQREASEAYIKSQAHEGWMCLKDQYDDGGFSGGSLERPALQRLLADIRDNKLDVIVVYKVDRLTRSLADFAKLVELFDAHGVSFVSVTQSFNTTSSMGRLTLNVLLSFAQFEREVTGERIRDKIAASKKKGMWMGGVVPLGYRVENRKLVVDEAQAEDIRLIFELYIRHQSFTAVIRDLEARGIRSRQKLQRSEQTLPFSKGALMYLLSNRIYLGEIVHRGKPYMGEHDAIVSKELFETVQSIRKANGARQPNGHHNSFALLAGLIFDDKGNRMTPVHVNKGGVRYRYYQSWVLAQGRKKDAGSVHRVPAAEVEQVVMDAIAKHLKQAPADTQPTLHELVAKITVLPKALTITVKPNTFDDKAHTLQIPWSKPSNTRKRHILPSTTHHTNRPQRTEARTRLLKAIAQGRRWAEQLRDGACQDVDAIATQQNLSAKTIRSTLSLAFLAPDIVQAAIDGTLPRGLGVSQMTDLPLDWNDQRRQLGLA